MVKIERTNLKRFMDLAAGIPNTSNVPITKYIKLETDGDVIRLTKTNLNSFVIHTTEGSFNKNFILIIEEEILDEAVKLDGDELKITFSEKGGVTSIVITDGDSTLKCQGEKVEYFPAVEVPPKENEFDLTEDMISSIVVAASHVMETSGAKLDMAHQTYVHIKSVGKKFNGKERTDKFQTYIAGYNTTVMYFKYFEAKIPEMVLEPYICKILKPFIASGLTFSKSDRYYFFNSGSSQFGFVQTEFKNSPEHEMILTALDRTKSFSVQRSDLIKFCKTAIGMNPLTLVDPCHFKQHDTDDDIICDYEYPQAGRAATRVLPIEKTFKGKVEKFLFNPKQMVLLLEDLPYEIIQMHGIMNGNYFVTAEEEADYVGCIRAVVINAQGAEYVKKQPAEAVAEKQ